MNLLNLIDLNISIIIIINDMQYNCTTFFLLISIKIITEIDKCNAFLRQLDTRTHTRCVGAYYNDTPPMMVRIMVLQKPNVLNYNNIYVYTRNV
jgi:hypothetical protein